MKRVLLVVVGVGGLALQSAFGQPLFDPFNYTEGTTLNNVGAPWSFGGPSGGGAPVVTAAAALDYSAFGLTPGSGLGVAFGATATGNRTRGVNFTTATAGTLYTSFLLDVTTAPTALRQLAFLTSDSAQSASTGVNGIFLNSSMQLGLSKGASSAAGASMTGALSLNTTYLVVVGYTFNGTGNEYDLWLNPTSLGGSAPTADLSYTGGTDMASLSYFFLQQRNNASNAGAVFNFDELRIGTSWADVTPTGVPEPTTFALGGLGLLGLILVRRARR